MSARIVATTSLARRQLLSGAVAAAAVSTVLATGRAQAVTQADKVVLIGLDGTMYRKIEEVRAPNLLRLSAEGTLGRSSIAPHISISGPSWATVLTGVWGGKHGITDNNFDATPFAKYPTVFTRLERHDPTLKTQSIATWDQIATMTASGDPRADVVISTPLVPDDDNESATDAATTDSVVTAITKYAPDFLFTHLDQVDRAGHQHGGASSEYREAVTRIDALVGHIVAAVDGRARANPAERWTILVTTDHGHRPKGGHGGQTPDETASFVIARGPNFVAGATSSTFSLVDITPTVLDIFHAPLDPDFDGQSRIRQPVEPVTSR
ncbi:alkaline phosphatase family protein [Nocardia anaemiae]|uniref:alkaline phosphatase family protein n=1 Tax=Nocardia anaemiae TaxID=263910 RepID=UPI0007A4F119|nr:alkaline phosphatase family protein [Nocardia anaemiae]